MADPKGAKPWAELQKLMWRNDVNYTYKNAISHFCVRCTSAPWKCASAGMNSASNGIKTATFAD
jgi:hypothetical protein